MMGLRYLPWRRQARSCTASEVDVGSATRRAANRRIVRQRTAVMRTPPCDIVLGKRNEIAVIWQVSAGTPPYRETANFLDNAKAAQEKDNCFECAYPSALYERTVPMTVPSY